MYMHLYKEKCQNKFEKGSQQMAKSKQNTYITQQEKTKTRTIKIELKLKTRNC